MMGFFIAAIGFGALFQYWATRGWIDEFVTWTFSALAAVCFILAGVFLA